jgi:hypothetical protein
VLYHPDLLVQAALEWEASEFRHLPSLQEIATRDLTWRQQVNGVFGYIQWTRKAADNPQEFGSIDDALKADEV